MLRAILLILAILIPTQCYAVQAQVTRIFDVKASFEQVLDFAAKNREYIFEDTEHRTKVVSIKPTTTTVSVRVLGRHVVFLTYKSNFGLYDNYAFFHFKQIGASSRFANGSSFKLELWRISAHHCRIRVAIWADAGLQWHLYSRRLAARISHQIDTIAARVRYLERGYKPEPVIRKKPSKGLILESAIYHIFSGVHRLLDAEK